MHGKQFISKGWQGSSAAALSLLLLGAVRFCLCRSHGGGVLRRSGPQGSEALEEMEKALP